MIPSSSDFYGDDVRWFVGTVISINDPKKMGRVRVRIHGLHPINTDDVKESDLPWAQSLIPVTEGGSSGIGTTVGIKQQAQVFGIFLDGPNSQLPLVMGSIPKIEKKKVVKPGQSTETNTEVAKDVAVESEAITLTGQTNIEKAFNFFISKEGGEFTVEQACGIIGNFIAESSLSQPHDINPTQPSTFVDADGTPEGSFGIAQWNPGSDNSGGRLGQLIDFCNERGYNYRELRPQLEFTKFELYTKPWLGLAELRKAKTVKEATVVFQDKFERPNAKFAHTSKRIAFAENVFETMEA